MIEIKNYDDWHKYDGLSQGSGRSEKIWLEDQNGEVGLFKFPKVNDIGEVSSTEFVSEHLASSLAKLLDIPVVDVDIGFRAGRIGCMSYLIEGNLVEGVNFIANYYPDFDSNDLYSPNYSMYYCVEMIRRSTINDLADGWFVPMMIFDFLIGNTDRHQSNWAMRKNDKGEYVVSPLYDNGSSLCSVLSEKIVLELLGNDENRFNALIDSKSQSRIRIDGSVKKMPTHKMVVKYLMHNYSETVILCEKYVNILNDEIIRGLLNEYPVEILSANKSELIFRFLKGKVNILKQLLMEVSNGK